MATLKKQEKTNKIASNNIFYSKVTSFVQCQLTGKDPEDGKDLRQEEKGMTEDGLLDGITGYWMSLSKLGDSEGQGSLTCCSPWGHRVGHDWATEQPPSRALRGLPGTDLCLLCPLLCLIYWKGLVSHVSSPSQKAGLRINERELPVQDGGVEGHALISFCERTKIITTFWTTINRRMLESTKNKYPTSKDKEATARW